MQNSGAPNKLFVLPLPSQTNFTSHRGQGHAASFWVSPQTLQQEFLISVIPAED